jgi:hypothetical protein
MAATYVPLVYRTSGGDQMTVASGGRIEIQSGGTLGLAGQALNTSGAVTLSGAVGVSGALTASDNFIWSAVAAASSGSTGFASYGITQIWSSGTATGHVFTMPVAAAAGVMKYITCNSATSTAPAVVTLAGTLIAGSNTLTFSTGSAVPQWIQLAAQNTTNWFVIGKTTDVAIS